jgi:RNA polymerase sigma-70 factor (ECF subfamily)
VEAAVRRVLTERDPEYEDLLQAALEAIIAAMRKDSFRGDSSLSTWASAIARNVAIDALRTRSRERRLFSPQTDTEGVAARTHSIGPNPELLVEVRQQLAHYRDALQTLCPTKAQVVCLSDVFGYRLEDVAAMLGISVAATQSRLVRGRKEVANIVASFTRQDGDVEESVPRSSTRWRSSASR